MLAMGEGAAHGLTRHSFADGVWGADTLANLLPLLHHDARLGQMAGHDQNLHSNGMEQGRDARSITIHPSCAILTPLAQSWQMQPRQSLMEHYTDEVSSYALAPIDPRHHVYSYQPPSFVTLCHPLSPFVTFCQLQEDTASPIETLSFMPPDPSLQALSNRVFVRVDELNNQVSFQRLSALVNACQCLSAAVAVTQCYP